MNAELRVWAPHLANQSLTVIERAVPFDSAGRSAVLTPEEFDCLRAIDCFTTEGPVPSIRDFLPAAFTVEQWLCSVGLSPSLVASFTTDQREVLALELFTIGGPFKVSGVELAVRVQSLGVVALPSEEFGPAEPLIEGHATDCECSDCGQEWLKANMPEDTSHLTGAEQMDTYLASGDMPNPVETGFQNPDTATLLGLEEPSEGEAADMLAQFEELTPDARAEFVLDGELSREQLDTLFNLEQGTKKLKSKQVLGAITSALQRLPNPTAHSVNDALVKASAKE